MENNEIMNVNEEAMGVCEMTTTPNPKVVIGVAAGLTALTGLGIFLAIKLKKGADARRIKALEKKGYVVCKPETDDVEETVDDCEE